MLPAPPPFGTSKDIAAFAATPLEIRLGGRDLLAMVQEAAASDENAPALSYFPSGRHEETALHFTRGELVRHAAAFADQLGDHPLTSNDVVASLLVNGPGTVAAALGTLSAATLAPVNIFLEAQQIRKLLLDSGAKAVLVPRDPPPALSDMFGSLRHALGRDGPVVIEVDCVGKQIPISDRATFRLRAPHEKVALFPTGGTTGLPKFVPLSARNLAAGAIVSQFAYGYNEADKVLCAMPMFHVGGLFACSLYPLACGAHVSILGPLGFRGEGVVAALPDTISALDSTVVIGPPTIMAQLANTPPDTRKARKLRLFVNGAAALPRILGMRLSESTGVPVVEPWGLTEATLAVTSGPRDGERKQGSVGLALPYCGIKAVRTDSDGKAVADCAPDEIGVLAIHGPMVFDGYLNRSDDQQPFFGDGWLNTGDLGRVDANGFVWVTGRAKELIKRGGHGIDPSMIEDVLLAHDGVALAAAIGKPDAYSGEVPVAYVQLRPGASIDPLRLIEFARERIPERAAVPKEIVALEKLPLTAVGKVHKLTLKLDATRRAADATVRQIAGEQSGYAVVAEPDPLHGLIVRARVPRRHVGAVQNALAAFAFRSETQAIEEET